MRTESEIRIAGVKALFEALGDVQAEKFIALIQREPFDYTKWQRALWPDKATAQISEAAMNQRRANPK